MKKKKKMQTVKANPSGLMSLQEKFPVILVKKTQKDFLQGGRRTGISKIAICPKSTIRQGKTTVHSYQSK